MRPHHHGATTNDAQKARHPRSLLALLLAAFALTFAAPAPLEAQTPSFDVMEKSINDL